MSEPIVQCTGLCKNYGQKTALDNVTFSLQRGRIIGLLGPNGSGKSTLMKLANGLLTPSSGEIRIAGNVPGHRNTCHCLLFAGAHLFQRLDDSG